MFNSHTTIEKLNAEVLIHITSYLDVASLLQLSLSAKAFRHLIRDELVFRRLAERDYRVTDKQPEQTWVDVYKEKKINLNQKEVTSTTTNVEQETIVQKETHDEEMTTVNGTEQNEIVETKEEIINSTTEEIDNDVDVQEATAIVETITEQTTIEEQTITQPTTEAQPLNDTTTITPIEGSSSGECPHLDKVSDSINEIKRIIYKNENPSLCDLCLSRTSSYLNMSDSCHIEACRSCLETDADDEEHFPVQLELSTGDMYCFKCKNEDGSSPKLLNQIEKAQKIIEYIKAPASEDDLDKRRKAEQQLYVQELRREDMSLKHYLVEKQWGRTWMLFRTREGSPLPGKITNQKLARLNGTLDPNIRLPMDKFRPSPETHGDIVSERLWSYLVKAYGVQGRAYSEDDIIAPEYARLRVYVDDYKKSIHLYP